MNAVQLDLIVATMEIENTYEDGFETTTTVMAVLPAPPEDEDERSEWALEYVFPHTGTGWPDGDAWYDVTVTASSAAELVGATFMFGY